MLVLVLVLRLRLGVGVGVSEQTARVLVLAGTPAFLDGSPFQALMTVSLKPTVPSVTSSSSDHPCAVLPASRSRRST